MLLKVKKLKKNNGALDAKRLTYWNHQTLNAVGTQSFFFYFKM